MADKSRRRIWTSVPGVAFRLSLVRAVNPEGTHLQLEYCLLRVHADGLNGRPRHEVEQAEDEVS